MPARSNQTDFIHREAEIGLSGGEEGFGFGARRETAKLAVLWGMPGSFRRPQHNEFIAVAFNDLGEFIAIVWRHMAGTAAWTIVVAHARPLILPLVVATSTGVVIAVPSHWQLFGEGINDQISNDSSHAKRNPGIHDPSGTVAAGESLV